MTNSPTRSARPMVVSVAVLLWWATCAVQLGVGGTRIVHPQQGRSLWWASALLIAWTLFIAWGALRMGRGGGTARFWLAVLAAGGIVGAGVDLFTEPPTAELLEPLATAAAAILTYLPAARTYFPTTERRPRATEPSIVGWDPNTGEPIRASD